MVLVLRAKKSEEWQLNIIVTGGCGFIGSNAVARFCAKGHNVLVIDNLSRQGTAANLEYLQQKFNFEYLRADLVNLDDYEPVVNRFKPDWILHCAGQVAVTTSVANPRLDFEGNVLATFNLLEICRNLADPPFFLFASTNKVYGDLEGVQTEEGDTRYRYKGSFSGVPESWPLNFHSPYGCSKGAADQYVLEYSRTYGIASTVFRQSCIYGPRQFGLEDQGWIAWFMIASLLGEPITIFGEGKQVRDALHVDDLLDAYELAFQNREKVSGRAYNIGGGPENTLSVLELVSKIETLTGLPISPGYGPRRPSDQNIFVSDLTAAGRDLLWSPTISVEVGLESLFHWIKENSDTIREQLDK